MTVYIVTHWLAYEGDDVEGVFASEAAAWKFIEAQERRGDQWLRTDRGYVVPNIGYNSEGWTFEAWPVQGEP